jgi:hypothetical protein
MVDIQNGALLFKGHGQLSAKDSMVTKHPRWVSILHLKRTLSISWLLTACGCPPKSNGLDQSPFGDQKNDIKGARRFLFAGAEKYLRKAGLLKSHFDYSNNMQKLG